MEIELIVWLIRIALTLSLLYLLLIWSYTVGWHMLSRSMPHDNKVLHSLSVSVIVAFRDEEHQLETLLQHLHRQDFDSSKTEILLINDHSKDASAAIAEDFIARFPDMNIKLLHAETQGKKGAIKKGISNASNSLLLFTDADCRPGPSWISVMVRHMERVPHMMAIGPVMLHPVKGILGRMQGLEHLSLMASTAGAAGLGMAVMSNGANVIVRREAIDSFHPDVLRDDVASGDDVFMMLHLAGRFGRRSIGFVRHTKAIVPTRAADTLKEFFRQRSRWVSKSRIYSDPLIIVPALVVALFNIILAFMLLLALFYPALIGVFLLMMVMKTMADYPLLLAGARFTQRTNWLMYVLPVQLLYPFYVLISVVLGFVRPVRWK